MSEKFLKIHFQKFIFQNLQKKVGLGSDMSENFTLKSLALQSAQGHPLTKPEKLAQIGTTLLRALFVNFK
jgi:hypothetical protein